MHRQQLARLAFFVATLSLVAWLLHSMLIPMLWAVVLAISTWPLFIRFSAVFLRSGKTTIAAAFTVVVVAALIVPIGFGLMSLADDLGKLAVLSERVLTMDHPAPDWLKDVPAVGERLHETWSRELGHPGGLGAKIKKIDADSFTQAAKAISVSIADNLISIILTFFTLFFLLLHGEVLIAHIDRVGTHVLGVTWPSYTQAAAATTHAVTNGMILLGIAEGLALGLSYWLADLPSPAILGTITGVLTLIPGPATLWHAMLCGYLFANGSATAGFLLAVAGVFTLLIFDNIARPKIIGESSHLPFYWVMVSLIGGVQQLGIIGLFLGPITIALVLQIWRTFASGGAPEPVLEANDSSAVGSPALRYFDKT